MILESVGAGCFGLMIGYVAWRVFHTAASRLDIKQLAAFIGALLGAAVLSVFPAGTLLFASYAIGLTAGFFFSPVFSSTCSVVLSMAQGMKLIYQPDHAGFEGQLKYIDDCWSEVERLISAELSRRQGTLRETDISALPLDDSGRIAALKKYARVFPSQVALSSGLLGWKLRTVDQKSGSG